MTKPLATTKLKLRGSRYVTVVMWPTARHVANVYRRGGWEETRCRIRKGSLIAFYGWNLTNKLQRHRGDLHLCLTHAGSGVLAHEIQHIINRWCQQLGWTRGTLTKSPYEEKIAELAEDATRNFWNWFYNTFEQTKSGKWVREVRD